jgi:uncharacterized membrane protein
MGSSVMAAALDFWSKYSGQFFTRWLHVIVGVAWIGLLYFFNFVQVPAFAEMEPAARNNAMDKLSWRALWWFRWAAVATVVTGFLLFYFTDDYKTEFLKTRPGISISLGILFGLTMFLNVWGVIWRKQKIVIANARNVQAGGEADPAAAAAGRQGLMASRMNAIFSIPMLLFMVGTAHFPYDATAGEPSGSKRLIFWGVSLVVWLLLELNALGKLGGTKPGGPRIIYDTHRNAIITGFVYALFSVLLYAYVL